MARKTLTMAQEEFRKTGMVESLLRESELELEPSSQMVELPLSQLKAWDEQPRKYFPPEHIQQLAQSIQRQGLTYPLIVRPDGNEFDVIVGECRFQACQLALHEPVKCVIQELSDDQALELALSENLDRQDLNPIEVLSSLLRLLGNRLNLDEQGVCSKLYEMKRDWESFLSKDGSQKNPSGDIDIPNSNDPSEQVVTQTFKQYGYNWYSYTCNQLKLRNLPESIYQAIASGKIEYSKGLKFKSIKDEEIRNQLLESAIAQGWSQRVISEKIKERITSLNSQNLEEPAYPQNPVSRIQTLTQRLKKGKLWKSHPKAWKKVETKIQHLETLLEELEKELVN